MSNEPAGSVHNVLPYQIMESQTWNVHRGRGNISSAVLPELASNATAHVLLLTNGNNVHFTHSISVSGPAYVYFYENVPFTDTGQKLTLTNLNRNYTTTSTAVAYKNPSFGAITSATLLWEGLIVGDTGGGGGAVSVGAIGGTYRTGFEWILKKHTVYGLKILNTAGVPIMAFAQAEWCDEEA